MHILLPAFSTVIVLDLKNIAFNLISLSKTFQVQLSVQNIQQVQHDNIKRHLLKLGD